MASILKVDTLQLSDGSTPTAGDLGVSLTSADMPAGSVVGIKSVSTSSSTTQTGSDDSTTYSNIGGLTDISYALKSSTNTLVIAYTINWSGGGSTCSTARLRVVNNGTNITPSGGGWASQDNAYAGGVATMRASQLVGSFQYTPNASSVSLSFQINATLNGGSVTVNGDHRNNTGTGAVSYITITEIAQ